jgi:hypothetical protein
MSASRIFAFVFLSLCIDTILAFSLSVSRTSVANNSLRSQSSSLSEVIQHGELKYNSRGGVFPLSAMSGSGFNEENKVETSSTSNEVTSSPGSGVNSREESDKESLVDSIPIVRTKNSLSERDEPMSFSELGDFDPSKKIPIKREVLVGNPQLKVKKKESSVTAILQELAAIQQQGPRKYCILGTRHCSYLHQQIIELLSYALVLSENHVYTSGAGGTNAAAIRGALRAARPDLLTVVLPQSLDRQPDEIQELLLDVTELITMPQNNEMGLDVASRLCNSKLLSETDQLIAFAFHESTTVIEATKEAKKLDMLVTMLFLD